eukprot:3032452-Heterocapsa_arctica.AAC.1
MASVMLAQAIWPSRCPRSWTGYCSRLSRPSTLLCCVSTAFRGGLPGVALPGTGPDADPRRVGRSARAKRLLRHREIYDLPS